MNNTRDVTSERVEQVEEEINKPKRERESRMEVFFLGRQRKDNNLLQTLGTYLSPVKEC